MRALAAALLLLAAPAAAQAPRGNTDEAKVGTYTLPPILSEPATAKDWPRRRAEILRLFEQHQFGRTPATRVPVRTEITERDAAGLGGTARRTQAHLIVGSGEHAPVIRVVLYKPAQAKGRVPVLLHIGFSPNGPVLDDPGVEEGQGWDAKTQARIPGRKATLLKGFDPRPFLQRGFAVAHVYYGDIEPDYAWGGAKGVRQLLGGGAEPRAADGWGAIGAWSWGLSRVADWFQQQPGIDRRRIALSGASRLGKTVLWAAAQDDRFSLVFPLISGEGGAALSRRDYGETIADLTAPDRYPYWFAPRYAANAADPKTSPVDSHMLLALLAPRPVLLVNGAQDTWSDPKGEQLAADAARPVWALLGAADRLQVRTHPEGHTVTPADLTAMADFMAREWSAR